MKQGETIDFDIKGGEDYDLSVIDFEILAYSVYDPTAVKEYPKSVSQIVGDNHRLIRIPGEDTLTFNIGNWVFELWLTLTDTVGVKILASTLTGTIESSGKGALSGI